MAMLLPRTIRSMGSSTRRGLLGVLAVAGVAGGVPALRAAGQEATPAAAGAEGAEGFAFADSQGIFASLIEWPPADANLRPFSHHTASSMAGTPGTGESPDQGLPHFHAEALIRSTGSLASESGTVGYGTAGSPIPYLPVALSLHNRATGDVQTTRLLPLLSGGDSFHHGANLALPGVASLEQAAADDVRFGVVLAVDPPPIAADPAGVGRHGTFEGAPPSPEIEPQRFDFEGRVAFADGEGVLTLEEVR